MGLLNKTFFRVVTYFLLAAASQTMAAPVPETFHSGNGPEETESYKFKHDDKTQTYSPPTLQSAVQKWANIKTGDLVRLPLSKLHPTQISLGHHQVMALMKSNQRNPEQLFNAYCEMNGQEGVSNYSEESLLSKPESFECTKSQNPHFKGYKTAVVGTDGEAYLTDGHHGLAALWASEIHGSDILITVRIQDNYLEHRRSLTIEEFWNEMESEGRAWMYNAMGERINANAFPQTLQLQSFENSKLRSLLFFARKIAFEKPEKIPNENLNPVPYLEFQWALLLQEYYGKQAFDLSSSENYIQAIETISEFITQQLKPTEKFPPLYHYTVKELGQLHQIPKDWKERLRKPDSILNMLFATSKQNLNISTDSGERLIYQVSIQ